MRSKSDIFYDFSRDPILTHFWTILGDLLGASLGDFLRRVGYHFDTIFQDPHLSRNGSKIDSKMETFGSYFGDLFRDRPKCDFGHPSHKNHHFFLSKGSQKASRNGCENESPKRTPKNSKKCSKWHPPGLPFRAERHPKSVPKKDQKKRDLS